MYFTNGWRPYENWLTILNPKAEAGIFNPGKVLEAEIVSNSRIFYQLYLRGVRCEPNAEFQMTHGADGANRRQGTNKRGCIFRKRVLIRGGRMPAAEVLVFLTPQEGWGPLNFLKRSQILIWIQVYTV